MTRSLFRAAVAMLVGVAAVILPATPSPAMEHDPIRISEGKVVEREYPAIPGAFPVAPDVNWTPGGCSDPTAGGTQCDTIPLEVVVPNLGPVDDFYVTIELSWEDPEGLADLDLYLWDDKQTQASQGDTTPSWTKLNQSASTANPEILKQFDPRLGKYNITVLNWAGPNTGYKLKVFITIAEFEEPFELLAPNFTTPEDTSDGSEAVQPFDYSAVDPATPSAPIAPTFGELPVQPDTSLDFGPSDFDQAIAAPPRPFTPSSRLNQRPPRPVPGAVAAFWFGAVPLVLVGGAVLLLSRRRRDAFAYA